MDRVHRWCRCRTHYCCGISLFCPVEVCPTRYEVATPILPRPQSYLSGGIPPRPRLAKGFLLCISYEVLFRSVTQPRSVASHTRSHPSPCCCATLDPPVSYVSRGLRPPRLTVSAAVHCRGVIYMDVTYLYHSYVYSMRTVSNVSVFGRIISLYLSCMRLDSDDGWLVSGIKSQRHITHHPAK